MRTLFTFILGIIAALFLLFTWGVFDEEDWLDCIEQEECAIDSSMPPPKVVRT